MKEKEEKYCGECCWFYGEDTDGNGFCAEARGESWGDIVRCDHKCKYYRGGCDNPCFVSKEEMRHYQAVLLVLKRWLDDDMFIHNAPDGDEVCKAIDFAVKYIKVFGNL